MLLNEKKLPFESTKHPPTLQIDAEQKNDDEKIVLKLSSVISLRSIQLYQGILYAQ